MKRTALLIAMFALAKLLLQLAALLQPEYGIFRDELYYLACTRHLAWGYVDQPPLSIAILRVWTALAGDSLISLRLLAGLFGAGIVALSGFVARRLGGGFKAIMLTCTAVLFIPVQLGVASFYSMNVVEYFLLLAEVMLLLKITLEHRPGLWIAFGIGLGLGIVNKHTFAVLAAFLLIGLLFTPARTEWMKKQFWIGIGIAAIIALPNFLWQFANGFPSLEFYARAEALKNVPTLPGMVLVDQILTNGPFTAILWLTGCVWFLIGKDRHEYRAIGIAFLFMLALMVAVHSSRPDRIASFIPVLAAGGAVVLERLSARKYFGGSVPVTAALLVASGIAAMPLALPVLSPEETSAYMRRAGLGRNFEQGVTAPLPQNLADRFGWKELADSVSAVYRRLPESDRRSAVLVGQNYGEAGALEYYGRPLNLPRAISGHNSYWMWGPGEPADVYIVVGNSRSRMEEIFGSAMEATRTSTGWQMNYECNRPIWICRKPKMPLREVWPNAKMFI